MAWLSGWTYRKAITVSNASANYPTKVLVGESSGATGEEVDCGGNVAADFDDLRFTGADGTTLLDYWIESITGTTPNGLATVWVENNATPDTTLYMYYGGTETAVSNGTNTFSLFDHFDDETFDTDLWDNVNSATLNETGTTLTITSSSSDWRGINSDVAYDAPQRIRWRGSLNVTASLHYNWTGISVDATPNTASVCFYYYYGVGPMIYYTVTRITPNWETQAVGSPDGNLHVYEADWIASNLVKFYIDNTLENTHTTYIDTTALKVGAGAYSTVAQVVLDWIFLAKMAATEPSFAFGAETTETGVPRHGFVNFQNPAIV